MKAHQRIIREKMEATDCGGYDLFGKYWEQANTDISNADVRETDRATAEKIILEYEWLGTIGTANLFYGIFYDGLCAGVVGYGPFQAMFGAGQVETGGGYSKYVGQYWDKGIQLTRGACVHWAHEHSGSKLISASLQQVGKLGYKFVVAFSDPDAGEVGTLYQATNWHYIGASGPIHYSINNIHTGKVAIDSRDFNKRFGCGGFKNKTEYIADKHHLVLKKHHPKGRYIYLLGSRRERKQMATHLAGNTKQYPKRLADN